MSDMTEIAAAKIGQERGNAEEKAFSAQMIADHTKTSEELKSMVPADAKAAIPAALDSSSQSKIDKLKMQSLTISRPNSIPCRLALIRMQCRCSSVMPRAVRMPS